MESTIHGDGIQRASASVGQKMRKGTIKADGRKVQKLREKKGWSQATLATKAGLESKKTISHLEAGIPVLVETLGSVARELGVEPAELLPGSKSTQLSAANDAVSAGLLPSVPTLLIGREQALKEIKLRLGLSDKKGKPRSSPIRAAVYGWPGVGKSTLIAALAHEPEIPIVFPDGVLWASLGQKPNLLSELAGWGRALGTDDLLRAKTPREASGLLTFLLRQKRMLLILDDVWEVEHAMPFSVGGRKCAILVSTRVSIVAESLASSPGDAYRLDVLSDEDALKLMQALAKKVVEKFPSECRELIRELEGLPLALQVAGRLLHIENKRGWNIRDLLRELREDAARILEAKAPADMIDLANQTTPTVAALLRKSTDHLPHEIRESFAYLGAFVAKPATFTLDDMAEVWEVTPAEAKSTADELIGRGLLEPTSESRFWMHALLKKLAESLCTE